MRIQRQRRRTSDGTSPTKGKRFRSVQIGPALCGTLADVRDARATAPTEWVFLCPTPLRGRYAGRTSQAPPHRKTVHEWHEAALEDAGLRDMPLHALRHTPAAAWLAAGNPLIFVQRQLGHRSITTTERFYGASPSKSGLSDGDFWYAAAAKLLAPLLYAAGTSGVTMDDLVAWVDTQDESAVHQALEATGNVEALQAMQANWARDDRQRSSIYTTAETVLEAYADPGVLAHSRTPEITPDRLLDSSAGTLYLCASPREQRRLRPVFIALLEEMLEAAYARASRQGAPLDPPLLVVLDEVANLAPLRDLDSIVSTGAGHGVQLLTVLQDLAQAHDRWGRERADTIVNNHRAKLLGAGLADERTLEWVGRLLGEEERLQRSTTHDRTGGRSVSEAPAHRMLAAANVVREAREGTALLVYGNRAPAWVRLRPWYTDPPLRARQRRGA